MSRVAGPVWHQPNVGRGEQPWHLLDGNLIDQGYALVKLLARNELSGGL
jgi:hypothetical protein